MPRYVEKAPNIFNAQHQQDHNMAALHAWIPPQYGVTTQLTAPLNTTTTNLDRVQTK